MAFDLALATDTVRTRLGAESGLNATVKLAIKDAGVIFVDAKTTPNSVSNDDKPADCTIAMSPETLQKLMDGKTSGTAAFMMGKLKISGDMGIALRVSPLLEG